MHDIAWNSLFCFVFVSLFLCFFVCLFISFCFVLFLFCFFVLLLFCFLFFVFLGFVFCFLFFWVFFFFFLFFVFCFVLFCFFTYEISKLLLYPTSICGSLKLESPSGFPSVLWGNPTYQAEKMRKRIEEVLSIRHNIAYICLSLNIIRFYI